MDADEDMYLGHIANCGWHVKVLEGDVLHGGAHVLRFLDETLNLLQIGYDSHTSGLTHIPHCECHSKPGIRTFKEN